jgi:tetratricopeptide (TPR) repeat protein
VRVYTRAFALKDSPYIDVTIQGIGRVFVALRRYADAEQAFKRALEIRERALGPNDYRVAITLNDLGSLYLYRRRYADAEPLLRRALLIFKSDPRFGTDHPFVVPALGHLGRALAGQGRLDEAESMYLQAISITEKALGPEHVDLAPDLTKLAALYAEQGKQADAERAYHRAIGIYEKALGDHPDLAQCLHGLGVLYQSQGRNTEAADQFTRSLTMIEKTLGADNINAAAALAGLAQLRVTEEKYLEAEPLFKRALAIMESAREPDAALIAGVLDEYAAVLRRLSREQEATEAETRARSLRRRPEVHEAARPISLLPQDPIPVAIRSPRQFELAADVCQYLGTEEVIADSSDAVVIDIDAHDVAHDRTRVVIVPADDDRRISVGTAFGARRAAAVRERRTTPTKGYVVAGPGVAGVGEPKEAFQVTAVSSAPARSARYCSRPIATAPSDSR